MAGMNVGHRAVVALVVGLTLFLAGVTTSFAQT
jgi:hypothetical protein